MGLKRTKTTPLGTKIASQCIPMLTLPLSAEETHKQGFLESGSVAKLEEHARDLLSPLALHFGTWERVASL